MSSPFPGVAQDPTVLARMAALLGSHIDEEQRVVPLGFIDQNDSSTVIVRFRAARACLYVRVQLQNATVSAGTDGLFARGFGRVGTSGLFARGLGVGASGGGIAYSATEYVSSSQVDCRQNRQQDVTVTRSGTSRHVVFLIPEFEETDGTFTKYDGVDATDQMAWMDIGGS